MIEEVTDGESMMRRPTPLAYALAAGALFLAWLGAACSAGQVAAPGSDAGVDATSGQESSEGPTCPDAGYPDCPDAADAEPSWATQIQPLVDTYCFPCHDTGGAGTGKGDIYTTSGGLRHVLTTALTDLHICAMPPLDGSVLPPAQREELMLWLSCGAPDN